MNLLYEGKCKKIFKTENDSQVLVEFKDDLTAFNGKKHSSFKGKGCLNRDTSSLIFRYLKKRGVLSHWLEDQGARQMLAQKLEMILLEVVVRNRWAGSSAKKFQKKEGDILESPLFEFYYKEESLGDPLISKEQAMALRVCSSEKELEEIKSKALKVNQELLSLFLKGGMDLIDFKLEFGKDKEGQILLGDEISADSCRIWKKGTTERLDKDRFRLDLGSIEKGYRTIYQNLSLVQP